MITDTFHGLQYIMVMLCLGYHGYQWLVSHFFEVIMVIMVINGYLAILAWLLRRKISTLNFLQVSHSRQLIWPHHAGPI